MLNIRWAAVNRLAPSSFLQFLGLVMEKTQSHLWKLLVMIIINSEDESSLTFSQDCSANSKTRVYLMTSLYVFETTYLGTGSRFLFMGDLHTPFFLPSGKLLLLPAVMQYRKSLNLLLVRLNVIV